MSETVKCTKSQLRRVYEGWKRDEIDAVDLIEATAAYLEGRPLPPYADRAISQENPNG